MCRRSPSGAETRRRPCTAPEAGESPSTADDQERPPVLQAVPGMKSVRKLTIHPYVYYRKVFWSWQEFDFAFQNVRVSR